MFSADWTWAVSKGALVVSRYRHVLPVMILYLVKRSRMSRDPQPTHSGVGADRPEASTQALDIM